MMGTYLQKENFEMGKEKKLDLDYYKSLCCTDRSDCYRSVWTAREMEIHAGCYPMWLFLYLIKNMPSRICTLCDYVSNSKSYLSLNMKATFSQ